MLQKIQTNTFVTLSITKGGDKPHLNKTTLKGYVKEYNADERTYLIISTDTQFLGRSITIREKTILEVRECTPAPTDLSKWELNLCLAYLTYEYNVLEFSNINHQRKVTTVPCIEWDNYCQSFNNMRKDLRTDTHRQALRYRKIYFASRMVPIYGEKKSRTVMRRLRKKSKMRNDNSSVSRSKQRTVYVTPVEALQKQSLNVSYQSRKQKKQSIPLSSYKIRETPGFPRPSTRVSISMEVEKLFTTILGDNNSPEAPEPEHHQQKKKTKKKKLDIPF